MYSQSRLGWLAILKFSAILRFPSLCFLSFPPTESRFEIMTNDFKTSAAETTAIGMSTALSELKSQAFLIVVLGLILLAFATGLGYFEIGRAHV